MSVILRYATHSEMHAEHLRRTIHSLLQQNTSGWECIILNETEFSHPYTGPDDVPRIRWIQQEPHNRARSLNTGVQSANGDCIVLVDGTRGCVEFRLSALEILSMVAERNPDAGLIYSDYAISEKGGEVEAQHLLDYHIGRVRDNLDLGVVWCIPHAVFESIGPLDAAYRSADLYDLRLRISEQFRPVHIQAARNGFLYTVETAAASHNVFDYLMADRDAQKEMEAALTAHLKRTGAYLEPGKGYREIRYTEAEDKAFDPCIASVVIPVFRRKEFIGTAIQSVQNQTVRNVEVIIVCNGGPEDETIEGVKPYMQGGELYDPEKPRVRLLIEDVNNIGFCLNKGIREACGKYYIQLDSDDRLKPDAVEKIIGVFTSDPCIGMVIGSYEVWKKDEKTGEIGRMEAIPVVKHEEWTEANGRNNLLRINGAGAPRAVQIKVIRELGGFGMNDTRSCRNYGEDYDMVLRISEKYRIGRVWEPIYDVIRHAGGTDHTIDQEAIDRNDNAKDGMREEAILRRLALNR